LMNMDSEIIGLERHSHIKYYEQRKKIN
jgi:hypothetical protein